MKSYKQTCPVSMLSLSSGTAGVEVFEVGPRHPVTGMLWVSASGPRTKQDVLKMKENANRVRV